MRKSHPHLMTKKLKFNRHDMQRLTSAAGQSRIYFPVETGARVVVCPDLQDFVDSMEERMINEDSDGQLPEDPRLFEPWLLKLGFIDHVAPFRTSELSRLLDLPSSTSIGALVDDALSKIFSEAYGLIAKTPELIRRRIMTSIPEK